MVIDFYSEDHIIEMDTFQETLKKAILAVAKVNHLLHLRSHSYRRHLKGLIQFIGAADAGYPAHPALEQFLSGAGVCVPRRSGHRWRWGWRSEEWGCAGA